MNLQFVHRFIEMVESGELDKKSLDEKIFNNFKSMYIQEKRKKTITKLKNKVNNKDGTK